MAQLSFPNTVLTRTLMLLVYLTFLIKAQVLQPPYLNLAEKKTVHASSTCGVGDNVPELYCRLTGGTPNAHDNLVVSSNIEIQAGQFCEYCDSSSKGRTHPADYAVDGTENWWQSPPLSRGIEYNEVNFTIDLGQEFQVSYIWIKMANSPRPAVWILERSTDFGKSWTPWQYFTGSDSECRQYFRIPASSAPRQDDEVICTTKFSNVVPLENGEIIVSLVDDRPQSLNFSNSKILQEWTKATNVRLRFLRTNTLLGHLMAVVEQDVTVTRRYFYSIRDVSIGGRCVCNGHAERCDTRDQNNPEIHYCQCQHNTCGRQCGECCPGFQQKKWRPFKANDFFKCEPCNCHNHSDRCVYDAETDKKRLSLDIHGRYSGGGVCQDCQHATEGINCERCRKGYYRDNTVPMNSKHACKSCECRSQFSTGDCDPNTGQCFCKQKYQGRNCDRCNLGYHSFPECKPCECNQIGTLNQVCQLVQGSRSGQSTQCPCKPNYAGIYCDSCQRGYFGFPDCKRCACDSVGSRGRTCDKDTGQCECHPGFAGHSCNQCAVGYFDVYNNCRLCNCDVNGCTREICDRRSGRCICKPNYTGSRCEQCRSGYYQFPQCLQCGCSQRGSRDSNCRNNGQCLCKRNFAGRQCNQCAPGFYRFPDCIPCDCSHTGSEGQTCNQVTGRCLCRYNFQGVKCDQCRRNFYKYPQCIECDCNPAGAVQVAGQPLGDCGLHNSQRCRCKDRVMGDKCDMCRPGFWDLDISHAKGCTECQCDSAGTIGGFNNCDWRSGQCICKPSVMGQMCSTCKRGSYKLQDNNPFGCEACQCSIGGSISRDCVQQSGACRCKTGVEGGKCDRPKPGFYIPTLHQHKYEFEDGSQYGGGKAIFAFNEVDFPEFSWRGYAIMSSKQRELLMNVMVNRPILCRIIVHYLNHQRQTVHGSISVTDNGQKTDIVYRPSNKPESSKLSDFGIPFVLNPGKWTLSFKADDEILLDYFVIIPQQYYEPTVLQHEVSRQCMTPGDDGPCLHYQYPSLKGYPIYKAADMSVIASTLPMHLQHLSNETILRELSVPKLLLMHSELQNTLSFSARVNNQAKYYLLINYFNSRKDQHDPLLSVASSDNQVGELKPCYCPYSTLCRQVVTNYKDNSPAVFNIPRYLDFLITGKAVHVYIESVAVIPVEEWNIRMIQPRLECIRVNKMCRTLKHNTVAGSVKIEAESGINSQRITSQLPDGIKDTSVGLIKLDKDMPSIDMSGVVRSPNNNHILVHYYQPKYAGFPVLVNVKSGDTTYSGRFIADYCPSSTGCRAFVKLGDKAESRVNLPNNDARIKLTLTKPSEMWIDYILLIPDRLHRDPTQELPMVDMAEDFLRKCTDDVLNYKPGSSCKKQLFTLTTDYNNGSLPCKCHPDGSVSTECDPLGGQCRCLSAVIGRDCSSCKPGFYGFPNCKRCQCNVGLCHPITGDCVCPPNVTGKKCDQCRPKTYAYDPYVGCKECNCNTRGVVNNDLNCDLNSGQCRCQARYGGRMCEQCAAGSHAYPHCMPCVCNTTGAEQDICDQQTGHCLCKKNVEKSRCAGCLPGSFYLEKNNPNGCTTCFCFGVISSCSKSDHRWSQVSTMRNWNIQNTRGVKIIANGYIRAKVNERVRIPTEAIYWSAPSAYLGNKIPSYGGQLRYKIVYSSRLDGVETVGPDVILVGNNMSLAYYSKNSPEMNRRKEFVVDLREYTFIHEIRGTPVRRDQFMMVLAHLEGIYIKASYISKVLEIRLSNVHMEVATKNGDGKAAHTVEKCHCPPAYRGTSCEKCAAGHYRRRKNPFFGFCSPCECNGHTEKCDPTTGECLECKHNTTGFYCDKCKPGYSGDPANGVCAICACPMPLASNNFAKDCVTSRDGATSLCMCKEGYSGVKCDKCEDGYYGNPLEIGGSCRRCQCNGNIDERNPYSCDPKTGECLNCTNNTTGKNCHECKEGWYGDPIMAKNCSECSCNKCGTAHCNNAFGFCFCKPKVIGKKCDRCLPNHYGFNDCNGCKSCDCGMASLSDTCDEHTGHCLCQAGVGGRKCDRCLDGFWDYGARGCKRCSCAKIGGYQTCDPVSGVCRCIEGYVGFSCDQCAKDWVKIPGKGCSQCDNCTKLLLSDLSELHKNVSSIRHVLQKGVVGIEAQKRLSEIKKENKHLRNKLDKILKRKFKNYEKEIEEIEKKASHTRSKAQRLEKSTPKYVEEAKELREKSRLPQLEELIKDIEYMIRYIKDIIVSKKEKSLKTLLAEAEKLKEAISRKNFHKQKNVTETELEEAKKALEKVLRLRQPLVNEQRRLNQTLEKLKTMMERIYDLMKQIETSKKDSTDAFKILSLIELSNVLNVTKQLENNISDIEKLQDMVKETLNQSVNILNDTNNQRKMFPKILSRLDAAIDRLKFQMSNEYDNKIKPVKDLVERALNNSNSILEAFDLIQKQYFNFKNQSDPSLEAATAYKNIVDAINEAKRAAKFAVNNSTLAQNKLKGVKKSSEKSKDISNKDLKKAHKLNNSLPNWETKLTDAKTQLNQVNGINEEIKDKHKSIDLKQPNLKNEANNISRHAEKITNRSKDLSSIADNVMDEMKNYKDLGDIYLGKVTDDLNDTFKLHEKTKATLNDVISQTANTKNLANYLKIKIDNTTNDLNELKKRIEMARSAANAIIVSLKMFPNTTLRLRSPSVPFSYANHKIQMNINPVSGEGLLAYVGNPDEAKPLNKDFLALELVNNIVVLKYNLGSGTMTVRNPIPVLLNNWNYIEAKRIGSSMELTVTQGNFSQSVTDESTNSYSLLEIDPETTYFYVGGYPSSMNSKIPTDVTRKRYHGAIEGFAFNDYALGLWNFVFGENNYVGFRNSREASPAVTDGYRFQSSSYAQLQINQPLNRHFDINMKFKTSKPNGLLMLMYHDKTSDFASLHLEEGRLVYQFDLGGGRLILKTKNAYNDGKWHKVGVKKSRDAGRLVAEGIDDYNDRAPGGMADLNINQFFIGGYVKLPPKNVSDYGFVGCIKDLEVNLISGFLNPKELYKISPGCPSLISQSVQFPSTGQNYVFRSYTLTESVFHLVVKFKVGLQHNSSILVHASLNDGSKSLTVSLKNDKIILTQVNGNQVKKEESEKSSYSDDQWHYITMLWRKKQLKLNIDDKEELKIKHSGENLNKIDLYLGGVPPNVITTNKIPQTYFFGCIEDVIINGKLFDFNQAQLSKNILLNFCSQDKPKPTSIVPTVKPFFNDTHCALPMVPSKSFTQPGNSVSMPGHRFGAKAGLSYWEFDRIHQNKIFNAITLEYKTKKKDGLLLYSSDKSHNDFLAIYLQDGHIVFAFNCGGGTATQKSSAKTNDGQWHTLSIRLEKKDATLQVDREPLLRFTGRGKSTELNVAKNIFVGGITSQEKKFAENVNIKDTQFLGCIRKLNMNNKIVPENKYGNKQLVEPCNNKDESGAFFGKNGGYIKLKDKFYVGTDRKVSFELRPRTINGVILAVHAAREYLVIGLNDGKVYATANNGKDEFTAEVNLKSNVTICDGKSHKISLEKSKQIIMLYVDDTHLKKAQGPLGASETNTNDPLYIGGLPDTSSMWGVKSRQPFVGCIQKLMIDDKPQSLHSGNPTGDVRLDSCPIV
ncbi:laminin subunit alpha-like [Argonauta hians]